MVGIFLRLKISEGSMKLGNIRVDFMMLLWLESICVVDIVI